MDVAFFSAKPYERIPFEAANEAHGHRLEFLEPRVTAETAPLAEGFGAVCGFVNDRFDPAALRVLGDGGVRLLALRSAGFNNVDLGVAQDLGITVAHVPEYSPHAVAEHAVALILALNRKVHRAYARVREGNFSLDGLMGFDLHGRTVGIVGTGRIGATFAAIMAGMGCRLLAHDPFPSDDCRSLGVEYVELEDLFEGSDIVSLHCPLTPETHHLVDAEALRRMRDGVMLVNTSRGGLVDTAAVVRALKEGKVGSLGLDVYEEEADLFFRDLSGVVIQDDVLMRLLTFPNVIVTGHQAFFTEEAVRDIAETTLANVTAFEGGGGTLHEVSADKVVRGR